MCVLYRVRTWRRPDSHVLCVPRRGFPRFAIPESRRPSYLRRKPGHRGAPSIKAQGKNNRLVARFHSPGVTAGHYRLHPHPAEKLFGDRRNHENSTRATLNIFARDDGIDTPPHRLIDLFYIFIHRYATYILDSVVYILIISK